MRCIINVALGKQYHKEQKRLGISLAKHFDGDFLQWTVFPNNSYNKANKYNGKAAAFEEAIKRGYKQILWLDCPVFAVKDIKPIFDSIEQNGYLTIHNRVGNKEENCAQTCSDACLAYFKVTRDQAEGFKEHAGGVIGIDMTNPKGKQLIETFIQACKDGACDGSRKHDGQSKDPRFKYHRQCQSVISLSANVLGLPPTMVWDDVITLTPLKKNKKTILCWSRRGGYLITEDGKTRNRKTRRIIKHSGGTRKHKESYIYIKSQSGLNDTLVQLAKCMEYALTHKRSIILEMFLYSATDLSTVFDFSKFPVPVYTNYKEKAKELASHPIEPSFIKTINFVGSIHNDKTYKYIKGSGWHNNEGRLLCFDFTKSYPSDTILMYACGGGDKDDLAINMLNYIRFTPQVKELYEEKMKEYSIPEEYISIHIRATDRKLEITNNITGMLLKDSNAIIKTPSSGNVHADSLKKIDAFIKAHDLPVFVSGDNPELIAKLADKYPNILQSSSTNDTDLYSDKKGHSFHYKHGATNENVLKNAIVDLLILAGAKAIMTSQGGYSRLAKKLLARKELLDELLS